MESKRSGTTNAGAGFKVSILGFKTELSQISTIYRLNYKVVLASLNLSNCSFDKPAFQILKRPQGCEMQSSSSHDMAKLEEKTKTMTLQV